MRQRTQAMTDHYTDEEQLGLGGAMRQLPPLAPGLSQLVPQNLIQESPVKSESVPEADSGNSSQSSEVEQGWPIQSSCVHPSPPNETGSCSRIRTYHLGIEHQGVGEADSHIDSHDSRRGDPDLAEVVEGWGDLSPELHAAIVAIVRSRKGGRR